MARTPSDGERPDGLPRPPRRPRLRISKACQTCRLRKAKCDGNLPSCHRCCEMGKTCTYSRDPVPAGKPPGRKPRGRHVPIRSRGLLPASFPPSQEPPAGLPSGSSTETPSTNGTAPGSEHSPGDDNRGADPDPKGTCYTAHGRFAGEVAAAIDARAGLIQPDTSHLVPFVDAPLFGDLDLDSPGSVPEPTAELPPRADADGLVGIYWQHIDTTEPVLDHSRFFRDYYASYSSPARGVRPHGDLEVWLCTLNAVFALAVQRRESTPLRERMEEGARYFRRAWALLRPETVLWKVPSLEVVQCLLLLNRYLHCTNNRHKTWMTAGLASRLGQTACGHHHEASQAGASLADAQLRERVWASCVSLDRCVSWSLGRAPSLLSMFNRPDSGPAGGGMSQEDRGVRHFQELLSELFEIGNEVQLAQTQTRNHLASRLELPRLYQQSEYQTVAAQLDGCLNRWEDSLPDEWKRQDLGIIVDAAARERGYTMHMRILHTRIFLFRPALATFYKQKARKASNPGAAAAPTAEPPPSLSSRLLKECSAMCVEAAQGLVRLIAETVQPGAPAGLLPWWYRVYALHIAGTTFLASMFAPDLFTASVSRSWDDLLAMLRSHGHLSAYVPQCVRTLETLSGRILGTQCLGVCGGVGAPELDAGSFEDIFQDAGFGFDSFLFGGESNIEGPWC